MDPNTLAMLQQLFQSRAGGMPQGLLNLPAQAMGGMGANPQSAGMPPMQAQGLGGGLPPGLSTAMQNGGLPNGMPSPFAGGQMPGQGMQPAQRPQPMGQMGQPSGLLANPLFRPRGY